MDGNNLTLMSHVDITMVLYLNCNLDTGVIASIFTNSAKKLVFDKNGKMHVNIVMLYIQFDLSLIYRIDR